MKSTRFFLAALVFSLMRMSAQAQIVEDPSLWVRDLTVVAVGEDFITWEWNVGFTNRTPPLEVAFLVWDEDGDQITGSTFFWGPGCAIGPRANDRWSQQADYQDGRRSGARFFGPGEKHAIRVQVLEYRWDRYVPCGVTDLVWGTTISSIVTNYPNPFNSTTAITYGLATGGYVHLAIYNLRGQLVEVLFDGEQSAGSHRIDWDATSIPSGTYFCRIITPVTTRVIRMSLMR